jgi:hypothetical protein
MILWPNEAEDHDSEVLAVEIARERVQEMYLLYRHR